MRKINMASVGRSIGLMVFLIFTVGISLRAQQENLRLEGKVASSSSKSPLAGATVHLKGTTHEVLTDNKGGFQFLTGQKIPVVMIVSFVGYRTTELTVNQIGFINIELEESAEQLNDVVVVGYGTQKRRNLIGSVSKIDPSETRSIPTGSFEAKLQGKVPGVQITTNTGVPGEVVNVRLRGATSINADNTPLYVIDGVFINS